jgi:hypothetical protein
MNANQNAVEVGGSRVEDVGDSRATTTFVFNAKTQSNRIAKLNRREAMAAEKTAACAF